MLSVGMRSSRPAIAREYGSVYLEVLLTPVAAATQRRRAPVALVLCLDRSGSMAESAGGRRADVAPGESGRSKMEYACLAAEQALAQLIEGDRIGFVTFSTSARVDVPLTIVSDATRRDIRDRIRAIGPEYSTNLAAGLSTAVEMLQPLAGRETPCKVIVLSDGLANVGVSDPRGLAGLTREHGAGQIVVSAIGVGDEYSAETMAAIAGATGGEFYHVANPADIETAVAAEVADITAVAARGTHLRLNAPSLVAFGQNLNMLPQCDIPGGVLIEVGDIVRPRQVIIEAATPVVLPLDQAVFSVRCVYTDPATARQHQLEEHLRLEVVSAAEAERAAPDIDLLGCTRELIEAKAIRFATSAYERGDFAGAGATLSNAVRVFAESAQALGDTNANTVRLSGLACRLSAAEASADEVKRHAATAYAKATSRPERSNKPE